MTDKTSIMKEAQKYLSRGQFDKAIAEWEKLIKEGPDGNVYNIIGDLFLKKGDRKKAIEYFHNAAGFFRQDGFALKSLALYKKVLNLNNADADALLALGQLNEEKGLSTDAIKYYLATADSLSKEGKKDRLLDIYEKILSLSPGNLPLRNKIAEIYLKEGLKSDAAKEYLYIARLLDDNGDQEKANEYLLRVLDIQPLNKEATIGIGNLYEKAGELDRAIEHMREATVLHHADTGVIFRYCELLLAGGRNEPAIECLKKIKTLDPENVRARRILGKIYLKAGSAEKAWEEFLPVLDEIVREEKSDFVIELMQSFREIDPIETGKRLVSLHRQRGEQDIVADELVLLGDAMRMRDMDDDALNCYKNALEIRPENIYLKEIIRELSGEPEKEDKDSITDRAPEVEKTAEEIFIETDIFSKYGLLNEAVKLLEGLKVREPGNIELHSRLKSLYAGIQDRELAVTECLILTELYKRLGDSESADKVLQEAFNICPEDPRLAGREMQTSTSGPSASEPSQSTEIEAPEEEAGIEDYDEEIAEADFYVRQGLIQEAEKILNKLHRFFPENKDVNERLDNLGRFQEETESEIIPGPVGEQEVEKVLPGVMTSGEEASEKEIEEEIRQPDKTEYEDLSFSGQELVEAQEMPEPVLDDDVIEIFQEFKKGLEKELGDEDSETHYNLGIAYKEMGLIDDAINEFQTSRNDPKRLVQSATMLGVCYVEKGMYSLAIDTLTKVINKVNENDDSYWPLKYDLADAYDKNNNVKEALDIYTQVYGWNAKFRSVSERISQLRTRLAKSGEQEKPKERKDRVSYL